MKYWTHMNNGRVGAHPVRPSSDWQEISLKTYCEYYAMDHDGKLPPCNCTLHPSEATVHAADCPVSFAARAALGQTDVSEY
jgi:hypothetical protein